MGRRKLFNGPLSLILTLITLLFLISFVVGQAPAPAPAPAAPAPAKAPAKEADNKKTKEPAKANNKAPAKEAKGKAKEDDAKGKNAKDAKGAKGKDAKGKDAKNAKADPKAAKALPAPPVPAAPALPPPVPAPPVPAPAPDPNLAKECNDCWTNKRSELPACKGISKEEFTAFNKAPNSPKVASCLCMFANSMASVFENECSAVCVDQKLITDLNNQASQYKTAYKCDDKGNSILGNSNLVGGSGNQTASAISNNINENNMILGLSFMIGMVSFLIFN